MRTQHEDKVTHLLSPDEVRLKYPSRITHVMSEDDHKELFTLRWDKDQAIISKKGQATKSERREWLLALADALEKGLWE